MRLRKVVTPGYRHSVCRNGSYAGIFMSTYFSVLSLHFLQSLHSSFVGFASFPSFLIPFSLFVCFPLDMSRVSQLVTSFLCICKPQIYSTCSRKPDYFLSFFLHCFFFVFWSFQLPLVLYILNFGRHPPLLNPFLFFLCDGSDGDYSYFTTTMIITMIMGWWGRETTVVREL